MSLIIGWAVAAATLALLPFYLLLAAVLVASILSRHGGRSRRGAVSPHARFLIVIPAHDEEALIAETVRSCQAIRYARERFAIHVIADNCSDLTAAMAREAGALVYERSDPVLK